VKHPIKAFSKAVLLGTLAGGALPMCFTLPIAIGSYLESFSGEPQLGPAVYLAGLPLWISFALVLASSIVVGLPAHLILRKTQRVSRTYYVSIGAIAGFLVPLAVLFAIEAVAGFWMALLGAFSGAITALSWSNSVVNNREPDKA
jgi:Na+-driven multidrug efflux pump